MLRGPVGILHNMSRTDYAASFFVTEKVFLHMVDLAEIQRRRAGIFPKDRDEMAGVCETGCEGNLLDLHVRVGQQQFFSLVDPVSGQIFVD